MKIGYIAILFMLMFLISCCIIYIIKKAKKYKKILLKLMIAAIIGTFAYILFLYSNNITNAIFWDALYFWMTDILSLFMMEFVQEYTEYNRRDRIWKKLLLAAIGIDGIAILINNKTHWMFYLEEKVFSIKQTDIVYFTECFKAPHYLHLGLCYIMVANTIGMLVYKILHAGLIHKRRYITILIPFLSLIIINAFCYTQGFPIDVSVALYGVLACIICCCTYMLIPNRVLSTAQIYVMDNIRQGVICLDENGKCVYINQAVQNLKKEKGENFYHKIEGFLHQLNINFKNENKISNKWNETVQIDEEERIIEIQYHVLQDKRRKNFGAYFILEDKTEEIRKHEEERYRANYDILTGLFNRTHFFEKVNEVMREHPDEKKYLIVSNIKDFKIINNIYGKEYGDELIKMQAELIKQSMESDSFCGRIYGDKFAMLVCKQALENEKFQIAIEKLQQFTMEKKYKICYHVGIYDITGLQEPAENLYNRVNMVINTIHDDYNIVFVECNQEVIGKLIQERNIINEFDNAILSNQFEMYLQPQTNENGTALGAEALVRWNHPEKGLIYPGDFIEVFEKAGLIYRLDLYIWQQAGKKLAEWKKQGIHDIYISVNISTKDFYYLDVYEELVKIVTDCKIDPKMLKLEITESAIMSDANSGFATITKLREYGFEVEIDDFGSEYSSLNMLKNIEVDVLKIDRLFLKETQDRAKSRMILGSVISLAKNMGMGIVTEGVEEKDQVNTLIEMGCNVFQGYYFDKPIRIKSFEEKYLQLHR